MPNFTIHNVSIQDFGENAELNRDAMVAIDRGLTAFNQSVQPDPSASPLVLTVQDADGNVIAGVLGRSAYEWLRVDIIWVADELRGTGCGSRLMSKVERIAIDRGCRGIHLDTHGFQAPGFYERLGYEVFGVLENYPSGQSHFYFRKLLDTRNA